MAPSIRLRQFGNGLAGDPLPDEQMPDDCPANNDDDALQADLLAVVEVISREAEQWRTTLAVSIGRASALTGLKETQIRYFEDLGALQPAKMTEQTGSNRLYTIMDLRRLYALGLLVKQGRRPAEAARLVLRHSQLIEQGSHGLVADILAHEGSAITDGFLLARLLSQVIDAVQVELDLIYGGGPPADSCDWRSAVSDHHRAVRISEILLPMKPCFTDQAPAPEEVLRVGRKLRQDPRDILVALAEGDPTPDADADISLSLMATGRDDRTVLFYSPERHSLPRRESCQYCAYIPPGAPQLAMVLVLETSEAVALPALLTIRTDARATLINRLLALCEQIYAEFRGVSLTKNYRYRSDGFQIAQTAKTYRQLLTTLRRVIFPDDANLAVLFIPNSLDEPTSLAVLTHSGYDEHLARRITLDLAGDGQGLSGRAYHLGEPFLSLDALHDPRVAYSLEEGCHAAFAVPLATSWGIRPFGVLYVASKRADYPITSEMAYLLLLLGSVLGEVLGRWWLTRLRRAREQQLQQGINEMLRWLDSLDERGPAMVAAMQRIEKLWADICRLDEAQRTDSLALAVIDIDHYRQKVQQESNEPFPVKAQQHVRAAIQKVVPQETAYWFRNDHALLILDTCTRDQASATMRRIANQVRTVPTDIRGTDGKHIKITSSATVQVLSYQDFHDLGKGKPALSDQVYAIVRHLREQTSQSAGDTVVVLNSEDFEPPSK